MIIAFLFGGNEVIAPDNGGENQPNTNSNYTDFPSEPDLVTPTIKPYPDQEGKFYEFEVSTIDDSFKAIIHVTVYQTVQVTDNVTYYCPRLTSSTLPNANNGQYVTPLGISYTDPGTNSTSPDVSIRFGVYNDASAKFCYRNHTTKEWTDTNGGMYDTALVSKPKASYSSIAMVTRNSLSTDAEIRVIVSKEGTVIDTIILRLDDD